MRPILLADDDNGDKTKRNILRGLSPRANYTDRATAACRQLVPTCYG
jgi:hypothetical protein